MSVFTDALRKRLDRKYETFQDLAPRIIIFDILSFYELVIRIKNFGDNIPYFGFFRRDRTRSIWYLFTSISFSPSFQMRSFSNILVDFSKVEVIGLRNWKYPDSVSSVVEKICREATKMYRLKKMEIVLGENQQIIDIFPPKCFPRLKSVELILLPGSFVSSPKIEEIPLYPFDSLSSLSIKCGSLRKHENISPKFFSRFHAHLCQNLQKLTLTFIDYDEGSNVYLNLPQLKFLRVEECKNILIEGESLKEVELDSVHEKILDKILERSRSIETLHLKRISFRSISFMDAKYYPRLSSMSFIRCDFMQGTQRTQMNQEWGKLVPQIEYFELDQRYKSFGCCDFSFLFNYSYHKIKTMKMASLRMLAHLDVHTRKSVLKLEMERMRVDGKMFLNNDFEKLESLSLRSVVFVGVGIKPYYMTNNFSGIRKLHIEEMSNVDELFRNQELPQLENLSLRSCIDMTGEGWNNDKTKGKFQNLKSLFVGDCKNFGDSFFQENDLASLEILCLLNCVSLRGERWRLRESVDLLWEVDDENYSTVMKNLKSSNFSNGIKETFSELDCERINHIFDLCIGTRLQKRKKNSDPFV